MIHKKYFLLSAIMVLLSSQSMNGGLKQSDQEPTRWQRFKEKVKDKAAETKDKAKERWNRFKKNVSSKVTAAKEKVKGLFKKKESMKPQEEKIYLPSQIARQEELKRERETQQKIAEEEVARFNKQMSAEKIEKDKRIEQGKQAHETTLGDAFENVPL